jgi:hypothetical protein
MADLGLVMGLRLRLVVLLLFAGYQREDGKGNCKKGILQAGRPPAGTARIQTLNGKH